MTATAEQIGDIRYWVRDTKPAEYLFTDDEIQRAYRLANESIEQACIDLLVAKIGELAQTPVMSIGRDFTADNSALLPRLESQLDQLRNRFGIHTYTATTELLTRQDTLTEGKVRAHGVLIDNPYNDRSTLWE